MSFLDALKGLLSHSGSASTLLKRGIAKAGKEDWHGAVADYTAVIDSSTAPVDLKAMAYFNRGLAQGQQGQHEQAECDLRAILAMADAPVNTKAAAKEKLARWEKRSKR